MVSENLIKSHQKNVKCHKNIIKSKIIKNSKNLWSQIMQDKSHIKNKICWYKIKICWYRIVEIKSDGIKIKSVSRLKKMTGHYGNSAS